MAWLRFGRWVCIGSFAVASAAACGGRGSLPYYADGDAGETSSGGSGQAGGGQAGKGGAGKAGAGKGGSAGVAGAGGSTSTCKPGTSFCQENAIVICSPAGVPGRPQPSCPFGYKCVAEGGEASCVAQVCAPGETRCSQNGGQLEECVDNGTSFSPVADCFARGQRCVLGACQSLMCQPNQPFCDETGVRVCSLDGTQSTLLVRCARDEYCDSATFSCKKGICAPNQPTCNGDIATVCNDDGSGYDMPGTDCKTLPDRQCVLGGCMCNPKLADCDSIVENGCETKVSSDVDNCGTCGAKCSSNHVARRSCAGVCNGTCSTGYEDCNGDKLTDGCEVATSSDPQNCGGCNLPCSTNHVKPSCSSGTCSGPCEANFADCNEDKQADGCESNTRTDLQNCGGCGLACSTNHVKPQCSGGLCSGACAAGFADCNGDKQKDGCEIDTNSDPENCGKCGLVCPDGQACNGGRCGSLSTFQGIAQNLVISSLEGWTQCLAEPYGSNKTSIAEVQKACTGSLIMLACRPVGSATLQLAAYAPRDDVFFDTGSAGGNTPHVANGVGWYYNSRYSWGFAPKGDPIKRSSCDTEDSSIAPGVDGDLRLCWHTQNDSITGGWRCGRNDNLNNDSSYERLIFTAN